LRHEFLMQANHKVAARLPSLKQIGGRVIESAHIGAAPGLRIGAHSKPEAFGTLTHPHSPCTSGMTHPAFAQSYYLRVSGQTFLPIRLLQVLN
jgi:hypothetical protein